jgi:hypothetical protein
MKACQCYHQCWIGTVNLLDGQREQSMERLFFFILWFDFSVSINLFLLFLWFVLFALVSFLTSRRSEAK